MRGQLITVEGGEGAGKSSCLAAIHRCLDQHGIEHVHSREPGGTAMAEQIRELLLEARDEPVCAETELLLMFAARKQNVEQLVKPSLDAGLWVLCDRFVDASYAYQGAGRGIPMPWIEQLDTQLLGTLRPDLTLLLDVEPEAGLARALKDREPDRLETEQTDFYQRVRQCYLERAARWPDRFRVVDTAQPLEQVEQAVTVHVAEFIHRVQSA